MVGAGREIRTPVGLPPNGFQDRLVMTTSICLRIKLFLNYAYILREQWADRLVMPCCGTRIFSHVPCKIRPRPLLFVRFICHRQRSQTSPLRYACIFIFLGVALHNTRVLYHTFLFLSILISAHFLLFYTFFILQR